MIPHSHTIDILPIPTGFDYSGEDVQGQFFKKFFIGTKRVYCFKSNCPESNEKPRFYHLFKMVIKTNDEFHEEWFIFFIRPEAGKVEVDEILMTAEFTMNPTRISEKQFSLETKLKRFFENEDIKKLFNDYPGSGILELIYTHLNIGKSYIKHPKDNTCNPKQIIKQENNEIFHYTFSENYFDDNGNVVSDTNNGWVIVPMFGFYDGNNRKYPNRLKQNELFGFYFKCSKDEFKEFSNLISKGVFYEFDFWDDPKLNGQNGFWYHENIQI